MYRPHHRASAKPNHAEIIRIATALMGAGKASPRIQRILTRGAKRAKKHARPHEHVRQTQRLARQIKARQLSYYNFQTKWMEKVT